MGAEFLEHSRNTPGYPSEKLFTLPEIKEDAYGHIYDRIVAIEFRKISEGMNTQRYMSEILQSTVYEYFGSLIRVKPTSLGLPEKLLLPTGEKLWKDLPLLKTSGEGSVESIALWETKILLNANALKSLRAYWEAVQLVLHTLQRDIWDLSRTKNIRLLTDDSEEFRMGLRDTKKDAVAKHWKRVTSVLRIEYFDWTEKLINIQDSYKVFSSPKTEKERAIFATIQQERKELKDAMNREPLFGGSLSYEYAIVWGVAVAWSLLGAVRVVKSIRYRWEDGHMVDIKPKRTIQWSKEQIMWMIAKEMETWGNMYNANTMRWENALEKAKKALLKRLPEMSVLEMNARTWLWIHPSRWDAIRANPENYMSKISYGDLTKKWLKWILNHGILFPLDVLLASEVATYSNSATVFSASSDLAAFYLGQKSIDLVSKLIPGGAWRAMKLARFPAWIVATMYSSQLWKEALEWNKKKWQYLAHDGFGSMYTDGQSVTGNMVWGGFLNFALDQAQKGKKAGEQLYDIGTTPWVFRVFGKELFEIPEVTFFQHKINLATDPGDWLRGQPWRTVDDWNTQIDNHLPHSSLRLVRALVERMNQAKYPFSSEKLKEAGVTKEEMLLQVLNVALSGGNDPSKWSVDVKWNILLSVERELKWWWKWESSMNKVMEVVYSQVSKLKIDGFFVEHYYPTQVLFHQSHIGVMMEELAKHVTSKELTYIQSIQKRMEKNEPLFTPPKLTEKDVLWTKSREWIPSGENVLFQRLLENTTPIQAVLDINPKSKPVSTTVWEYFAYMLNILLEQKRRKEFYSEIQKWNKKWVQWTL